MARITSDCHDNTAVGRPVRRQPGGGIRLHLADPPFEGRVRLCLCLVLPTACVAKTLPLPSVSTASVAKTLPCDHQGLAASDLEQLLASVAAEMAGGGASTGVSTTAGEPFPEPEPT